MSKVIWKFARGGTNARSPFKLLHPPALSFVRGGNSISIRPDILIDRLTHFTISSAWDMWQGSLAFQNTSRVPNMPELEQLRAAIRKFRDERDWMQFHNPKNLACSIVIEAAELLEHFQWKNSTESEAAALGKRDEIAEEIADVAIYLIELADNLGIDLAEAIEEKLRINSEKYPAEKAKGTAKKYSEL